MKSEEKEGVILQCEESRIQNEVLALAGMGNIVAAIEEGKQLLGKCLECPNLCGEAPHLALAVLANKSFEVDVATSQKFAELARRELATRWDAVVAQAHLAHWEAKTGSIDDAVRRLGKASTRLGAASPRQRKSFSEENRSISETLDRMRNLKASQSESAADPSDKLTALPDTVCEPTEELTDARPASL